MEGRRRSPHPSPSRGHGEGHFPGKEVALELLSFIWKDEKTKAVALGMSVLAKGAERAKAGRREAAREACGLGW